MKILIVSDAWFPQLNGVVRTYEYLKDELERQGHIVCVIGPSDFKYRFPMPGYSEIEVVLRPFRVLAKKIDAFRPDAIHIATEGALGWAARRYCLKRQKLFTTSYHTQFPEYAARRVSKYFPFLYKSVFRLGVSIIKAFHAPTSTLFVTTKSMTEELKSWGITASIQPLTRGIDTDLFHVGDSNLFTNLKRPVALYVGRLAIEKSVEEFLEMPWDGSKVVVGHGPDERMLRDKFPRAYFVGKKTGKELADHYRSADVFTFPSRTDTFGIVLIEALACGLPVAAHNVIGPRDVIIEKALGALDEDLQMACKNALKQGTKHERYQHVVSHYTWEKAAQQFLDQAIPN